MNDEKGAKSELNLELAEYKMFERVEERLLSKAKSIAAYFAAGLTLFGLLGGPLLVQYLSEKVGDRISERIESDTKRLRDRLDDDLTDIAVKKAELEAKLEQARTRLDDFQKGTSELRRLLDEYKTLQGKVSGSAESTRQLVSKSQDLEKQVRQLQTQVGSAVSIATTSQLRTDGLSGALASSAIGGPALLLDSGAVLSSSLRSPVELTGLNLGTSPGRVFLRARGGPLLTSWTSLSAVGLKGPIVSDEIELDREAILEWTNSSIKVDIAGGHLAALKEGLLRAAGGQAIGFSNVEYQIETVSGEKSGWLTGNTLLL